MFQQIFKLQSHELLQLPLFALAVFICVFTVVSLKIIFTRQPEIDARAALPLEDNHVN